MTICDYIIIAYFAIGLILVSIWWFSYYKEDYENDRENGEASDSFAIIFLISIFLAWPIKLIKDYFESFINDY